MTFFGDDSERDMPIHELLDKWHAEIEAAKQAERERLAVAVRDLLRVGSGEQRGFAYAPVSGAERSSDFRFLFDEQPLSADKPPAPEGYRILPLPLHPIVARKLAREIAEENGFPDLPEHQE